MIDNEKLYVKLRAIMGEEVKLNLSSDGIFQFDDLHISRYAEIILSFMNHELHISTYRREGTQVIYGTAWEQGYKSTIVYYPPGENHDEEKVESSEV